MAAGSAQTRLIVLRGNSGSGKSTVARALRAACSSDVAWVSQDILRRVILKEKDRPGGVNIGLIGQVARYALDNGYHVVLDGILYADRYETMLAGLSHDHQGLSRFYYFDISLDETLRRHLGRPQASEFGAAEMRAWYQPEDLLAGIKERIIPESCTLEQTVSLIMAETGLQASHNGAASAVKDAAPLGTN